MNKKEKENSKQIIEKKFYILFIGMFSVLLIFQLILFFTQTRQIRNIEDSLQEQFSQQTKEILDFSSKEIEKIKIELEQQISDGTNLTGSRITGTNSRIQRIDVLYSELLAEQQKRTLDSLYTESVLIEKEQNAAIHFRNGDYAKSNTEYEIVSKEQPANYEARFYYLYTLFLINKMDRSNYSQIKEGFEALERNGYNRQEIRDVLIYIELEEKGFTPGVPQ
jgi:hypothetical protein